MAVNDTLQLAVIGDAGGETHVHTLHFRHMTAFGPDQNLIDTWQATCRTQYRALFTPTDNPVRRIVARMVCGAVPLRAPAEETEVSPNIVGSSGSFLERVPTWLASVSSVRTRLSGKSRRGRYFIGGMREDDVVTNNLEATYKVKVQAYATALLAAYGDAGTESTNFRLVVHSRKIALTGVNCEASSEQVTAITAQSAIGSMKSRKPGHGS